MQEFYRIIITPYHFDTWSVYTTDKELFDKLVHANCTEDAVTLLGVNTWEDLIDSYQDPVFPYVLLGEVFLKQRD